MKEKERAVNTDTSKEDCSSDTGDAYVRTDILVIVLDYGNAAIFIFLWIIFLLFLSLFYSTSGNIFQCCPFPFSKAHNTH